MKLRNIAVTILTLFALVTIFMSGSVIFDLFGIREKEGNYVLFIVVTNFVAGFTYLMSAYGLQKDKAWTARLLTITTGALILSFCGLLFHINSGGAYEMQTVKAMIFRISLTVIFTVFAWRSISKSKQSRTITIDPMNKLTILSITLLLGISCSTERQKAEHDQGQEAQAHHDVTDPVQLDNGKRWMANIETTQGIEKMTQMIASTQEDPSSSDALQENLLLAFTDILNKCMMKGESHEQLHNYLLHLKGDIEQLSNNPSTEALNKISAYLDTYYNYFE